MFAEACDDGGMQSVADFVDNCSVEFTFVIFVEFGEEKVGEVRKMRKRVDS